MQRFFVCFICGFVGAVNGFGLAFVITLLAAALYYFLNKWFGIGDPSAITGIILGLSGFLIPCCTIGGVVAGFWYGMKRPA